MGDLSPMMKQYLELKKQYPNTLLFFRLGDFYEMFFEDAKTASRELELTLTGRDCGLEERAPMCGVPFHSYEGYVAKLVAKGYKVAICEQMEDPAAAKGIVKREVIRVVTPGTVMENSMLEEGRNNYIASVYCREASCGICFADISTGAMLGTKFTFAQTAEMEKAVCNELARFSPREILVNPSCFELKEIASFVKEKLLVSLECIAEDEFLPEERSGAVYERFSANEQLFLSDYQALHSACGVLLCYLKATQKGGLERIRAFEIYEEAQFMRLDLNARRNLELLETMRGKERRGTLLWVLDKTKTSMGKRLMRTYIEQPLINPAAITRRLNAVEELFSDDILRGELADNLVGIFDMERIMTRIVYGSCSGRELRSLCSALQKIPSLKEKLSKVSSSLLKEIYDSIDPLEDVRDLIEISIVDDPPFVNRDGGMIRAGYNEQLDQIKSDVANSKELVASLEAREKERTGIPKLRVGFNRVFGYYIEISNSYKESAPAEYIRKQTLANCERYITQELKELENRILGAGDRSIKLEIELFEEIRKAVAAELPRIQKTAEAIANLDVITSLASVSRSEGYTRPQISLSGKIVLRDSRHPVVEKLMAGAPFVPNDVDLDMDDNRIAIITGPNMAGKSTYMRQTALIVLMAQMGCFVPASYAEIGVVDSIFTRVGASDDLSAGQSTFMVEMSEVADILKNATSRSFIIFDEIGRGTSTFDGMSIARAVLEYVADKKKLGAKTMFATHYHELTEMESLMDGVKNYNIAVKKRGDDITFLRRIIRGGADDSFGIEVAKLAGVPNDVIRRAKSVLAELEAGKEVTPRGRSKQQDIAPQLIMTNERDTQIVNRLKNVDVNTLTPIESLTLLFELSKLAKEE